MLSCVQPFATPWTVAHQAPLSTGFSRQEYFREFPFPSPKDLPDPGVKPLSLVSPAPAGRLFTTSATWEAYHLVTIAFSKTKKLIFYIIVFPRDE